MNETECNFSDINHGVLIIEMFLLCILARFVYRRPEADPVTEVMGAESGTQVPEKYEIKKDESGETESRTVKHYGSYDNQALSMDEHSVE